MDLTFLLRYQVELKAAAWETTRISALTVLLGTAIALVAVPVRVSRYRLIRWTGWLLLNPFRILPALVLLVWGFYGMPMAFGLRLDAATITVLGLGLNMAAFTAELFRAALEGVPADQVEAAQLLGLSRMSVIRHVLAPMAIRNASIPYLNQVLQTFKLTVLAAVIGVPEIYHVTSDIIQQTNRPLEGYTALAVLTFVPLLALTLLTEWLEHRASLTRHVRRWAWIGAPR